MDLNAMTGIDGCFTVQNKQTKEYKTFKLSYSARMEKTILGVMEKRKKFMATGIGFFENAAVHVWQKNKNTPYETLGRFLQRLITDDTLRQNYEFLPAVTCRKCGLRLDSPESIALGIGPDCASR